MIMHFYYHMHPLMLSIFKLFFLFFYVIFTSIKNSLPVFNYFREDEGKMFL